MPLEEGDTFFFAPRPLKNLVEVDQQESLSPIMNCKVSKSSTVSIENQHFVISFPSGMDCGWQSMSLGGKEVLRTMYG